MILLALAGPWLALGFLLLMQQLERWLDKSLRRQGHDPSRTELLSDGEDVRRSPGPDGTERSLPVP